LLMSRKRINCISPNRLLVYVAITYCQDAANADGKWISHLTEFLIVFEITDGA
jgi:hypothetical protein